ncbi:hypothetical protein [Kurthia massiliensis]|uniref:hypothetical protein n=1 Tax=Kurthia massiliensis TaxID=1033739 RepID=UPI000288B3F3|nr:hypothetical protein [Kurthia massiliensis]
MKKLLLAATLAFGATTAIQATTTPTIEASAKSYAMSNAFAKDLRNGTMPRAKIKVGSTFSTLKKKYPNRKFGESESFFHYRVNSEDSFAFMRNGSYVKNNDKVVVFYRTYDYLISKSSIQKHFGKPVLSKPLWDFEGEGYSRGSIYKAGKYYIDYSTFNGKTSLLVGTKIGVGLNSNSQIK